MMKNAGGTNVGGKKGTDTDMNNLSKRLTLKMEHSKCTGFTVITSTESVLTKSPTEEITPLASIVHGR